MMFPNKIGQELTHYPHVFPNFSIFLFLVKRRRFIVMLCFSLFLYTPKPYQIQRMLRIQVNILCLFFSFGIFVSFFLVSNFDFSLQPVLSWSYFIYFIFNLISYFITSSLLKVAHVFFSRSNECVNFSFVPSFALLIFASTATTIAALVFLRSSQRRCSVKKRVFLEISQNSDKNTCAKLGFLINLEAEDCSFIKK